jgi:hypothetical protein
MTAASTRRAVSPVMPAEAPTARAALGEDLPDGLLKHLALLVVQQLVNAQEVLDNQLLLLPVQFSKLVQLGGNRLPIRLGGHHQVSQHGAFIPQSLTQLTHLGMQCLALCLDVFLLIQSEIELLPQLAVPRTALPSGQPTGVRTSYLRRC